VSYTIRKAATPQPGVASQRKLSTVMSIGWWGEGI